MANEFDLSFPANSRGLHAALQIIEEACASWNVDAHVRSRARIVFEELFTNTVKYGYGGECDRAVRLRLSPGKGLCLTYEDDAPEFDPTAWEAPADWHDLPGHAREGQAGIAMLLGLCSTVEYQRPGDANRLIITLQWSPSPG